MPVAENITGRKAVAENITGRKPSAVREVAVPRVVRAVSTLSHIDAEDAYLVEIGSVQDRTDEQWARAMLEEAPMTTRHSLRRGWSALGLKLGSPGSSGFVLGWEVRRSTPDFVLLGAGSHIGMPAEVLLRREQDRLLLATFVQQDNPLARVVWAGVRPLHRRVVPSLLAQRSRSISKKEQDGAP